MQKFLILTGLEGVAEARSEWGRATAKFNADVEAVMGRLIREAAVQHMSVEQVAKAAGMTPTRLRKMMRDLGLNPKFGKNLLAQRAAEALSENAALLGVEPHEFDLMSPLAYLKMGTNLREFLETKAGETEEAIEDPTVDDLVEAFQTAWHQADDNGLAGSRTRQGIKAVLDMLDTKPVTA